MGEVANDAINGLTCEWCGSWVEAMREHGHPVVCKDCWDDATSAERKGHIREYLPATSTKKRSKKSGSGAERTA